MRKLIYLVASSIDGSIADPARKDPSGAIFALEGAHAEPLMREYPEMVPADYRHLVGLENAENRHFDTVVEGRVSYAMAVDLGVANAYPHLHHLVFSRTLTEVAAPEVELVSGDAVERIRALKKEDGKDIWRCGGGSLAASLRDEIDEIHLKLNPVVLGSGTPLFDGEFQVDRYTLAGTQVFDSSVALLTYVRA